jgi:microcompartment protein CcmL/EutN
VALAVVEVGGWSPALVILDRMEKTAEIRLLQTELNDQPGVCMKFSGELGAMHAAAAVAEQQGRAMRIAVVTGVIANPAPGLASVVLVEPGMNPLIEQWAARTPRPANVEGCMAKQTGDALGLIETQGFTAVFEAIDTAVKAANVEVVAREKLGGGYITVVIRGDVASVRAAVEAGAAKVAGLGKLIAAHVIASPSEAVLSLLPK